MGATPEASSSPGCGHKSWGRPWFEGLKGTELRGPLAEKLEPEVEDACKRYLTFVTSQEYSKLNFGHAAALGSEVLKAAGGWEEANRGVRRTWVVLKGDHFEGLHSDFFEGLVSEELLAKARDNAIWGISARYEGGTGERVQCGPHPSLREHLDEAAQQLWKDASRGRVLLCYDENDGLLNGVVSVAMARVPKMLPDRTVSDKGRVIWDAKPVNQYCDKTRHPPALQPKHEEVARLVAWWRSRFPNTPILLSKKDVSDAFKWIPVRSSDTRLFAADLPGAEFGAVGRTITVLYNSLTFGWCGAPGEYMLFAWLIKLSHSKFRPEDPSWNDLPTFRSLVLMDDAVLIEPKLGVRPWSSVVMMEECTKAALGLGSINAAKDAVEGALETRKLIWGLLYDTERDTRTLPPAKLEKAAFLLHLPEFDHGNTMVPLKLVQELRGNQQFWISVLPSLKILLGATNALLGPPTVDGMAKPRGTAEEQRRIWVRFWESIELQRLLVENKTEWEVRFTNPMTEALSIREILALPGGKERIVWASGDATLERLGAVDWTHKEALSLEVGPYQRLLEEMEVAALEDPLYPRRDSRPDGEEEDCRPGKLMVALTELLAVLMLAVQQHAKWQGKIILYMGDNQVVVQWINQRKSKHPLGSFLLQTLAAIEASYGFFLHTSYLRTYHNVVADALTRQDAVKVMRDAGLRNLPNPEALLQRFLDRGWQRRALVWAGQAEADTTQALRLSESRNVQPVPRELLTPSALGIKMVDLNGAPKHYSSAFLAHGADVLEMMRTQEAEGETVHLVCASLNSNVPAGSRQRVEEALRVIAPRLVWIDLINKGEVASVVNFLKSLRYQVEVKTLCGRSLKDQVWWKRWVVVGSQGQGGDGKFGWVTADDEPVTPPLAGYPAEWIREGKDLPEGRWEKGLLKLDSSMPYLGATKPKPAGTILRKGGGRGLVWDPRRPLPGLHAHSWDEKAPDRLLLLGKGPDGPGARTLLPDEAIELLHGRKPLPPSLTVEESTWGLKEALSAPPRSLALLAVKWSLSQMEPKVGVCRLKWEDETERVLMDWLKQNPATGGLSSLVGGKKKGKAQLPEPERAMKSISYVLRHGAGTAQCPISEEGWVRWEDLVSHESCRGFGEWVLWHAVEADAKSRVIAKPDKDGVWWVAAWSGHTLDRVVGPSAVVPVEELPTLLVHGSYRRHSSSIQRKGLLRQKRDLHFHDPNTNSEKWRVDLETRIDVDVPKAVAAGCVFRKTGNGVWLCDRNVPPGAILGIKPWDNLGMNPGADALSSGSQEPFNSAALDVRRYWSGHWQPKLVKKEVTEELAQVAKDLSENLPESSRGGVAVDLESEAVTLDPPGPEARFAPGDEGAASDCDWSASESEVEIVQASSALKEEDTPDVKEEPSAEIKVEAAPEVGTAETESKGLTPLGAKVEEQILEDQPPTRRRRTVKLGSAHLLLLKAVADADAANWEALQETIKGAPATAQTKSEFVERLGQLAELRVQSQEGAERKAKECTQRANQVSTEESEYRNSLTDQMLRLERMNPVGPRASVPLVSDTRLQKDIESGMGIWQARRDQRARERAARHRQGQNLEAKREKGAPAPGPLTDVDPSQAGEALDNAFAQSARNNLKEFKQLLREEAHQEQKKKKRQPDSSRRRKEKKQRRKEKARGETTQEPKGEEEVATGQGGGGPAASSSPGLAAAVLASTISQSQAFKPPYMPEKGDGEWAEEAFLLTTGFIFDVLAVFGLVLGVSLCFWRGRWVYTKVTRLTRRRNPRGLLVPQPERLGEPEKG